MGRIALSVMLGFLLFANAPLARAAGDAIPKHGQEEEKSPQALAREGAEKFMEALRQLLEKVPRYGLPHTNERGDIIIPRLDPKDGGGDVSRDGPEETTI